MSLQVSVGSYILHFKATLYVRTSLHLIFLPIVFYCKEGFPRQEKKPWLNLCKQTCFLTLTLVSLTSAKTHNTTVLLWGRMKYVFCCWRSHSDLFACCCAKQFPFCPSQCLTHKGSGWKCRVCRRGWWDFRLSAVLWTSSGDTTAEDGS